MFQLVQVGPAAKFRQIEPVNLLWILLVAPDKLPGALDRDGPFMGGRTSGRTWGWLAGAGPHHAGSTGWQMQHGSVGSGTDFAGDHPLFSGDRVPDDQAAGARRGKPGKRDPVRKILRLDVTNEVGVRVSLPSTDGPQSLIGHRLAQSTGVP